MTDSGVFLPKLSNNSSSFNSSLQQSRTFLQSTKATSVQNSPSVSRASLLPFNITLADDFSPANGTKLASPTQYYSVTAPQTPKQTQINFRSKPTLTLGDQEEQSASARTSTEFFRKTINTKSIISKVNKYNKNKGLSVESKGTKFEKRLSIFEGVSTYVDTRQLLTEAAVVSPSLAGLGSNPELNGFPCEPKNTENSRTLYYTRNLQSLNGSKILQQISEKQEIYGNSRQDEEQASPQRRSSIAIGLPEYPSSGGLTSVRKNYMKEVQAIKKITKNAKGSQLVGSLVDHLSQVRTFTEDIQGENTNKFETYVNKGLTEIASPSQKKRQSISVDVCAIEQRAEQDEDEHDDEKQDPQIEMFHKVQQYKDQSKQVIKTLRNTLMETHKQGTFKFGSRSFRESTSINEPYMFSPVQSPSSKASQKTLLVPSISLKGKKGSISSSGTPTLTSMGSFKNFKKHGSGSAFLINTPKKSSLRGSRDPSPTNSEIYPTLITEVKEDDERKPVVQPQIASTARKERRPSLMSVQLAHDKNSMVDIRNRLESLSNTNRELSKQITNSIRQIDETYSKQKQLLTYKSIPDSLQIPIPEEKKKSSTKLARSLADKLFMSK